MIRPPQISTRTYTLFPYTTLLRSAARLLPMGNLGTRIAGCIRGMALLPWLPELMQYLTSSPARAVANFHTLFNVAIALVFLPLLKPYATLITRLLPKRVDPHAPSKPLSLNESAHEVPAVTQDNATRKALRLPAMWQYLPITRAAPSSRPHSHQTSKTA